MAGVGISFGGLPRWTGIRANWRDRHLERIDGVNVTLGKPGENVGGSVNGLAIGLFNPSEELHGVPIGVLNHAANNPPPFRWVPILNLHLN